MTHAPGHAPAVIRYSNPLTSALLKLGVSMGPNGLLTVRGRTSGQLRTAPVAVVDLDNRRYVIGAYGDVQWTRNLRAAGEADFRLHGRTDRVTAHELDRPAAIAFFRDTLPTFVGRLPWIGRAFAQVFFRIVGSELLNDPELAATTKPVFELRPAG
jgi:deazaflavin-dependent oxidoreductase (nitroreductase family)